MTLLSTDPLDLLLDHNGDLDLTSMGAPQFSSGQAGVAQLIQTSLNEVAGEWFLNLDAGIPYFERDGVTADQAILAQKFDEARTTRIFRDALLAVEGVSSLNTLSVSFNSQSRVLTVTWVVLTEFGDTVADSLSRAA